jgi:hypothetical protein
MTLRAHLSSVLATLVTLAMLVAACCYRPVHGGPAPERLAVVRASSNVPDAIATDEVLAGVRDELARAGALAPGAGYPRCEVEILRADEASEGIGASTAPDGRLVPESRATRVGIVARAWISRGPGGAPERDTGDVRAFETVSVAADARTSAFRQTDALRAAGRRAGRRLGARILGLPSASED